MALQFELAGAQIDGAREYQEDAFLITNLNDAEGNPSALIIIADGMGGHAAGNVASNMAVQAFNKHVSANYPSEDPADVLYECVIKANTSIKETIMETPALSGMGCTIVAAILENEKLWWVSVGDSHLYLLRDDILMKKNADHSYGGFLDRMEAEGTPVEPEPGLARNMLMSAVTGDEINDVDVSYEPTELYVGDRVILCSDGMDTLSTGKIIQFSEWSETPKDCTVALLAAVEDAGMPKQDNTTVVVVDVKEKTGAAAPGQEAKGAPAAEEPAPAAAASAKVKAKAKAAFAEIGERGVKGKTGLIIGIAAVILIGIVAGVFLMQSGGKAPPSTPTPPAATAAAPPAKQVQTPAPAKTEAPAPPAAPKQAQPAPQPATEVTPKPKAKPAPAAVKPVEFSDTLRDGGRGPTMVWIPAGSFEMGSPGSFPNTDERPQHKVTLKRFAMSKYEITFAQYDRFARATGRYRPDSEHLRRSDHPVFNVKWNDAVNYAKWLSRQTGKHYRLPSEAEWEYAAGAGRHSTYWWGYDPKPGMAYCFSCSDGLNPRKPTKIGSFAPNPFGLYDTAGNVAEWVEDCWHQDYKGAPTDGSVWKGGDCNYRDVRGGAYSTPPSAIRHDRRDKYVPDSRYDFIGIRLVRDP